MFFSTQSFTYHGQSHRSFVYQRGKGVSKADAQQLIEKSSLDIATAKVSWTIQNLLWNLLQTRDGSWACVSLDKAEWATNPILRDQSYVAFKNGLAALENRGLIEILKGYRSEAGSRRTKIRLSVEGVGLFQEDKPQVEDKEAGRSYVRMGEKIIREDVETSKILQKINTLQRSNTWSTHPSRVPLLDTNTNNTYTASGCAETEVLDLSVLLKQVRIATTGKNGKPVDHGGRLYSDLQNIPKQERTTLMVNGKETAEIDLKANHLSILYAMENHPLPEDPYFLPMYGDLNRDLRPAFKALALIVINAKSRASAIKAFNQSLRNEPKLAQAAERLRELSITTIALLDAFSAFHGPISKHFYSGVGLDLMGTEGDIALEVMQQMGSRPCLPIHDGFRCAHEDMPYLRTVLLETVRRRLGYIPRYEVEGFTEATSDIALITRSRLTVNADVDYPGLHC